MRVQAEASPNPSLSTHAPPACRVSHLAGYAHYGMLRACQFILSMEMSRLQETCRAFPG
jgi:hypothetical protein